MDKYVLLNVLLLLYVLCIIIKAVL